MYCRLVLLDSSCLVSRPGEDCKSTQSNRIAERSPNVQIVDLVCTSFFNYFSLRFLECTAHMTLPSRPNNKLAQSPRTVTKKRCNHYSTSLLLHTPLHDKSTDRRVTGGRNVQTSVLPFFCVCILAFFVDKIELLLLALEVLHY